MRYYFVECSLLAVRSVLIKSVGTGTECAIREQQCGFKRGGGWDQVMVVVGMFDFRMF